MRPNLDPLISAELPKPLIRPAILLEIALNSGTEYVWSGVGDLAWNGHTFKGLGMFASLGPITENSEVQAEGTTVTLSGIGVSDLPFPSLGVTPPAFPRATVPGENVAWSLAGVWGPPPPGSSFSIPPSIWNGGWGVGGGASATQTAGSAGIIGGDVFNQPHIGCFWESFPLPLQIPTSALITGVYPVATITVNGGFAQAYLNGSVWSGAAIDVHTLAGLNVETVVYSSLPAQYTGPSVGVGFVGAAVYYQGAPLLGPRMMHEALADIRLGAKAKIWLAMFDGSPALLGSPYLIFRGVVDKPNIKISPDGSTITIALENRLINLQRANNRKLTSADQRIYFPNDNGFAYVEILQEMSLQEGS